MGQSGGRVSRMCNNLEEESEEMCNTLEEEFDKGVTMWRKSFIKVL